MLGTFHPNNHVAVALIANVTAVPLVGWLFVPLLGEEVVEIFKAAVAHALLVSSFLLGESMLVEIGHIFTNDLLILVVLPEVFVFSQPLYLCSIILLQELLD